MSNVLYAHARILCALGVALFAIGCANDTIHVRDKNAITAAGRVAWQVIDPSDKKVFGFAGVVLDGELAYVEAGDRQQIAPGNQVSLGNTMFPGPATLRSRGKIIDATANVRSGLVVMDVFRVEPLLGIQVATVDLELSSAGAQESDRTTAGGIVLGLRVGLQPHELIEFYGQASYGQLFGGDGDNGFSESRKLEAGARLLPFEHFGVFAAYREARFFQIRNDRSSDSKLDFRGPILGMELRF